MIIVVYILTHRLDITCQRHRAVYCHRTVAHMNIHITLVTEVSEASGLGGRSPTSHGEMIDNPPSMPLERQCNFTDLLVNSAV